MTEAGQLAGEEILEFAEQMEASSNKLGTRIIAHFMREALLPSSDATRELVGDLVVTTMMAVGKEFSATPRTGVEIEDYDEAMADMLRAYLTSIVMRRRRKKVAHA